MLRRRSGSSSSLSQGGQSLAQTPISSSPASFDRSPLQKDAIETLDAQSRQNHDGISDWEAGVSLAKAIMGAGSFALPWAFSKMGYLAGPMVLVIFLGLSVHSIGLLVDCARWLRTSNNCNHSSSLSYVDVARATFGPIGAAIAYASSIASSIGVCGSYLVFVAVNLSALMGRNQGSNTTSIEDKSANANSERKLFLLLVWTVALPVAVLLSSVRDPKRFAAVSMWGDLSVVAGMLAVVVYGVAFAEAKENTDSRFVFSDCVPIGSPKDMALALGSIGYLFLVHFLVLPIESSMGGATNVVVGSSDPEACAISSRGQGRTLPSPGERFQTVVVRTFLVCGGIGGAFGIIGYFLFGGNTQQIVLLNVEGSIGMAIVQSLLCIDLLLTYPVVMRPSISILEEHWKGILLKNKKQNPRGQGENDGLQLVALVPSSMSERPVPSSPQGNKVGSTGLPSDIGGDHHHSDENNDPIAIVVLTHWNHMAVCLSLGVVAAGAGSFVPAFGLLSGLVGGVSQTFLAFVLPPLMWAKQRQLQNSVHEASAWAVFGSLPWREKTLVLCGLGLIGWTLQSTWAELGSGEV